MTLFVVLPPNHDTINHVDIKITKEDNNVLISPFSKGQFCQALFQMHYDKSPGPDGFNPAFYKHFWYLIGDGIFMATTSFLNIGEFPPLLKNNDIVLITKKENPLSMLDLRPKSLCNVLYIIISKVLANSLKKFAP